MPWTVFEAEEKPLLIPLQAERFEIVDMPEQKMDLLHKFLRQNNGQLSKRARTNEFAALTTEEVERAEALYRDAFQGLPPPESDTES